MPGCSLPSAVPWQKVHANWLSTTCTRCGNEGSVRRADGRDKQAVANSQANTKTCGNRHLAEAGCCATMDHLDSPMLRRLSG